MRFERHGNVVTRTALVAGALALAGCVPNAYLYDAAPAVRYGSGGAPYPPAHYYGDPWYYAHPGVYGHAPYPPRVVYHDHDHRGDDCRHPSHRDGRHGDDRDGHDRNDRDRPPQDRDGRPDRRPPDDGPAMPPPQWRNPPRAVSPEGPGSPPQARPTTTDAGAAPSKRHPPADPDKKSRARKDLD
jgi:hypothetical protein